ncbi:hypothetical protein H8356DRAFT_1426565 [Neocallimastix lanati (nom. inval.)]|nr:hypothetical protein H8356DRAFT_1426565 [Neocallimastix sp. JGI-2020a]
MINIPTTLFKIQNPYQHFKTEEINKLCQISHCYISPYYCYSHCDFENKILVMNFVDKDVSEYELNLIYITINSSTIGTLAKTAHQNAKIICTINFYTNINIYTVMFFNFSISSLATIKKLNIPEVTQESENYYEDNINHLLLNVLLGGHADLGSTLSVRSLGSLVRFSYSSNGIRRLSVVTSDTTGSMDGRNTTSTSTSALDIIKEEISESIQNLLSNSIIYLNYIYANLYFSASRYQ